MMDGIPQGLADFAPLTDADRTRAANIPTGGGPAGTGDAADAVEIMPCPEQNPPVQRFKHREYGEPSRISVYRTEQGAPIVVAARYDFTKPDGTPDKIVLPFTFGRRVWTARNGEPQTRIAWHSKAPPSPRPLYGLDRLATRPDAAVLVCEGEKAADAASALFPDIVCITSQGGSKAPDKSDWTPLRGRTVTIWPDHDEPGAAYTAKVAELATAAGAVSVRTVEVPADWPEKWDLADALPDTAAPARLHEMLEDAPEVASVDLPAGFRMNRKGLWFDVASSEKNPDPPPVWIAAPFSVMGQTCTDAGEAWGLFLRWRDRRGYLHQRAIPRRLIHRQGNEIAEELEHAGLACGSDSRAHELLKRFIGAVTVSRSLRCVARIGWHQTEVAPVFVLPDGEAFGRGAADVILQSEYARSDVAYRAAGKLADWKAKVAGPAVGNDRLVLFIAAAFAGPLLDVLSEPSGGVHLVGNSRTGKSTAAILAGSVWGKPSSDAQMRTWRGTSNGLEATATDTSDALLILDEMGQADAREVGDVVYMLANESGKQRAARSGGARSRQSWRTLFLSTGETTLAQKMGEAGKRTMAGLEVRLINLPADAGAGLGVFQQLHGRPNAATLAEEMKSAAFANHGTAARAYLSRLAQDRSANATELRQTLDEMRAAFIAKHVPLEAAGQVRSVAARFALIGAAGELARDYGVLPWPAEEARRAAGACFAAWLAHRGGAGSSEDATALAQVRAFLEAHGESRFTLLMTSPDGADYAPDVARTVNRAGFRRRVGAGEDMRWEYLVQPETWKADVCKGLDASRVAELLHQRGFLIGWTKKHPAPQVRIPNEGKPRLLRISGAILGGELADGDTHGTG
jgi:uncharacterized protein (DUF927 family)